ncbi:DUF6318 family protein [Paenarthrobacter sp. NPDC089989]|uniref:DUF6318 family protein n=1 Tax=unclassified Paenarthrobacter TaxID=2634190 RepID=UPI00380B1B26
MLVSGCQGGGAPSETSTTTATPTSSASAPETRTPPSTSNGSYKPADATGRAQNVPVPVMPALAKENTKEGLEAFIRYWYATYSYATETGDMAPWAESTDTTTESGIAYSRAIEANYADGRWLVGGRITIPTVEVLWNGGSDSQVAKVQVLQEEIRYFRSDGSSRPEISEASNTAEAVKATFQNGFWRVIDNGLILG